MPAPRNLKVSVEIDDEIVRLAGDFRAPKGLVADVLLRYVIRSPERVDQAFEEWRVGGIERVKDRRAGTIPIRTAATKHSERAN